MGFRRRQVVTAALVANAIRPLPGFRGGLASFFPGWLTGELAPHVLTGLAADTGWQLARGRRDKVALGLAAASTVGLGYLIRQGGGAGVVVRAALDEGLAAGFDKDVAASELVGATTLRRLVNPFGFAGAGRRAGVKVHKDIAYAPDHGKRGLLDVYTSVNTPSEGAPVLLHVHGGGWTIGNKEQQGIPLLQHLAAKGWVCVTINYRLAPRDAWPAQIVDVKAALAWVKGHVAEYGGDPGYVAITGGSAGGHLTALAALTPNAPQFQPGFEDADTSVQVAVPHYGVYDFAGVTGLRSAILMRDRFLAPRVVERRFTAAPEVFADASPILHVSADAPDMFVLHGTHDTLVDVRQARAFVARLRNTSKSTVTYAELPGTQHGFDIFPSIRSQSVVRAIDRYLTWHRSTWQREHQG
ncbi:MAG: alpha/beta hydrolase [Nocardioidaceae bacterium]|nr:alpha/beta hydrolase [Nocardioidaceae bacterium]MCL2614669.1 alpha/beta hydrolase [Nocardioidaceae bacterium]